MNRRELAYECGSIRSTLADVVSTHWGYTDQEPLAQTCCGFATDLLQAHLKRQGIDTERHIAAPPLLPKTYNGRKREHVVLRTEDNVFIDPTYQQFMNLVGYTHQLGNHGVNLQELLPPAVIMTYDHLQFKKVGNLLAQHALGRRKQIIELGEAHGVLPDNVESPLMQASAAPLHAVYKDIWNPEHYSPFSPSEDKTHSISYRRANDIMKQRS